MFAVKNTVDILVDWACHPEKYPGLTAESPRLKRMREDQKRLEAYFRKRS